MSNTALQTTSNRGGVRPNSGRKLGTLEPQTIERRHANKLFNQRVRKVADKLFVAQSQLALGSMKVIRVDEITNSKGDVVKKQYVHVTDTQEIIDLLTEHHGLPGLLNGSYYFFEDVAPDNKALDSLLNRGLGKPAETFEISPSESLAEVMETLKAFGIDSNVIASNLADEIERREREANTVDMPQDEP